MKPFLLALCLCAAVFPPTSSAQTAAAVPVDQEPQHKVVFKNEFVRVLDATLPPGYVTLNHAHNVDNVSVAMSTTADGQPGRGFGRASFVELEPK
jgi:hypothetical protein